MTNADRGASHLLSHCGSYRSDDRVVIVHDPSTASVGRIVAGEAEHLGAQFQLVETPEAAMHGEEPPPAVAAAMARGTLVLGLRAKSMAHTKARSAITGNGGRYLSLPDYSPELLADPSLAVDYQAQYAVVRAVTDVLTASRTARVTTGSGTDIRLDLRGRVGNCCPGFVAKAGEMGSPPDIESNISPLEDHSEGVVVVDGSIPFPGFGLLSSPIRLTLRRGRIVGIDGEAAQVARLEALFDTYGPDKPRILAELGIGLNPAARLTGVMLTDEGALGTIHFGFGSNSTVGGINEVPFHIDFVFRSPTLVVDGRTILNEGQLTL
jgi:leucyl aminopeptidase (aminopeptidase T)